MTGASLAWTDLSPSIVAWRDRVAAGDFVGALAAVANDKSVAADEAREMIARLRHEWSLDADTLLGRVRKRLPDITREQFEAWTASGALESRVIDGQRRYFRREPRNLFLFNEDARTALAAHEPKAGELDRHGEDSPIIPHVVDIVAAAERSPGARELLPVRTRCAYEFTVKADRPGARRGSIVRVWLPYPQVYGPQRDVVLVKSSPAGGVIAPEGTPQRTVYFEQTIEDPSKPIRFEVTFEYTTAARVGGSVREYDKSELAERPPHIVFSDEVKAIVAECSADKPDAVTLARRLWNWVDDHIPWRAEHEYGLIPSIAAQVLKVRKADCGAQTLLFMSLCRFAGIPARWQSGFTTEPFKGGNLHDWSEVYLEELGGWVPADVSYGKKRHDDPRVRAFYFGGLDRYRLIVNTDYGQPLVPPKQSLRSEPLDFQRGEVEIDGRNLYFDEWDYDFRFTHEDVDSRSSR